MVVRMCVGASILLVPAVTAQAAETVTYSYDALGRLTASSVSGGPANGVATGTSFDPAGNRTSYSVSGSTAMQMRPQRTASTTGLAGTGDAPARAPAVTG